MSTPREFLPPDVARPQLAVPPDLALAGLDYPTTTVGTVGNITVDYATSLGQNGQSLAQQMLGVVTKSYQDMETCFGVPGGATTVVIAPLSGLNDGSGGAYHYGCDFASGGVLYLDATFSNTVINPLDLKIALYVAELSEAFMGTQNTGWGCGSSNGEGLSRYLAEVEPPPDPSRAGESRAIRGRMPDSPIGCRRPRVRTATTFRPDVQSSTSTG